MLVAGIKVTIPAEDPLAYDVDWRNRITMAVCTDGHRLPKSLPRDEHLWAYTAWMRQDEPKRDPTSVYSQASSWHVNEVRHAVESLLVTTGSTEDIATLLHVTPEALTAYGKIFWDVRDDTGVQPNAVLNVKFNVNVPDSTNTLILRNAALTGGFSLVKSMLASADTEAIDLSDSAGLRRLVNEEFARRLLSGRMSPADLSRVVAAQAQLEKLKAETGEGDKKLRQAMEFINGVLALKQPYMEAPDEAASQAAIAKYHERAAAHKNISVEAVPDAGVEAAVKQWNSMAQANMAETTPTG